jgi:hypothetical protein
VTAERYLAEAIRQDPNNSELTDLLQTANLVLAIDPLSRGISDAERSARVLGAFRVASQRLRDCAAQPPAAEPGHQELQSLIPRQAAIQTTLASKQVKQDETFSNEVLDLVFAVEKRRKLLVDYRQGKIWHSC